MPRNDIEEEKKFEEDNTPVRVVTPDQLINFKLDNLTELVQKLLKMISRL